MLPDFKGEIAGGTFNVFEAGKLGSGLKIFVDPNRHGATANEILLGYKSNSTTYGAGVVYSPQVPREDYLCLLMPLRLAE